jgi:phosphoglycerate dehydrogenase-like enzyme
MLREGAIFGAGLDVTDPEPPEVDDPILGLENVITTGHALAWTEESLQGACEFPCRAVADAFRGDLPDHVVNKEVTSREGFRSKLARRASEAAQDLGSS